MPAGTAREFDDGRILETLEGLSANAHELRMITGALRDLVDAVDKPADPRVVVLTQATPKQQEKPTGTGWKSFAIVNPTAIEVRIGWDGRNPEKAARAFPLPPNAAVVLPNQVQQILSLGPTNAADLAAGDAVLYVFGFKTVQPFSLYRL